MVLTATLAAALLRFAKVPRLKSRRVQGRYAAKCRPLTNQNVSCVVGGRFFVAGPESAKYLAIPAIWLIDLIGCARLI
jgi:hypothetical protein